MTLTDMLIKEGSTDKLPNYKGGAFTWDYADMSLKDVPFSQQELIAIAYLTHVRKRVVKSGFSFIGSFDGKHRSGKSLTATTWGYIWDETFWKRYPYRLVREPREFVDEIELIAKQKIDGAVIQIDEAGVSLSSADWYERWMKTVFKMVQMFGYLHPIVLFTAPVKDFIDARLRKMFHAYYNVNRFTKNETMITPYHVKYSSIMSKTYHKKPVLRIAGQLITLRRIKFGLPPAHIIDRYEDLADARKDKMLGVFKRDIAKAELKEQRQAPDIKEIINHVVDNYKIFESVRGTTPAKPKLNVNAIEYTLKVPNRQATYIRDEAEKIIHKTIKEQIKIIEEGSSEK